MLLRYLPYAQTILAIGNRAVIMIATVSVLLDLVLVKETRKNLVIQEIHQMFWKEDLKIKKVEKAKRQGIYGGWYVTC